MNFWKLSFPIFFTVNLKRSSIKIYFSFIWSINHTSQLNYCSFLMFWRKHIYSNFWQNIWKYFPESIDRTRALVYSFLENVFAYPNYNVILKIFIKITNESGCGIPIGYKNKNLVTCINWLLDVSLFPEFYFVSSRLYK